MLVTAAIVYLIWYVAPVHGNTSIFVYLGICSLIGSLSVMSVKARVRHEQQNKLNFDNTMQSNVTLSAKPPLICITSFVPDMRVLACFTATVFQTFKLAETCERTFSFGMVGWQACC